MLDTRPILFVIGLMIAILGLAMLVPMLVDYAYGDESWQSFALSSIITILLGLIITLACYTPKPDLQARGAFLLTVTSWCTLSVFAAIPFLMSPMKMSFTDALFESISGITTTGATVLNGLDELPKGILLWRSILQWIGGIGIVVTAIAILPMLKVGGMQLFRLESSDVGEKILPRAASIALAISLTYLGLTMLCALAYFAVGLSFFDAVAHAMTTLATGGYSTSDASMGRFTDKGADIVCILFMIAAALPFGMYLRVASGHFSAPFKDPQIQGFIAAIIFATLFITLILWQNPSTNIQNPLRSSAFNVISIITGTGYASTDYSLWGSAALTCFFIFMFIGGCAGSTACSIKIFRYQVAYYALRAYLFRIPTPHAVTPLKYGGKPLPESVIYSVLSYFFLFFFSFAICTILLSFMGLDSLTAYSGAASALANVGPGLGDIIGPTGTYQPLPELAKWVLMVTMIIGRLEIVTVLLVLTPAFWRA